MIFRTLFTQLRTVALSRQQQTSSVVQSCPTLCNPMQQHARPPCPSPTPGVHPNPCPSSQWCHPAISSSIVPFSSCPQSFPASGSFPMSQQTRASLKSLPVLKFQDSNFCCPFSTLPYKLKCKDFLKKYSPPLFFYSITFFSKIVLGPIKPLIEIKFW